MKHNSYPLSIALVTTFLSFAPAITSAQGPLFGVKGGVTVSNLYSSDVDDENSRVGFNLGVLGRTDPEQPVGLQVEVLYTTKGAVFMYDGLLIDQEFKLNLAYLDVPVMVALRAGRALEFHAGGYGGLLLASNLSTSGDLGTEEEDLDKDNFHSMDYGLLGGIAFNAGALQLGARYHYGLSELADADGAAAILGDAKNSYLQVYAAFGLGGAGK